jgi:hypothetical protein
VALAALVLVDGDPIVGALLMVSASLPICWASARSKDAMSAPAVSPTKMIKRRDFIYRAAGMDKGMVISHAA